MPLIRAFIIEAEATGANGAAKREAVLQALEAAWPSIQATISELRGVDFEDIEPYVGIAADGIVALLNTVFGQVWSFVEEYVINPVEGWVGFDIDRDGDIDDEPVSFRLEPVE